MSCSLTHQSATAKRRGKSSNFNVEIPYVEQQKDNSDCGVFAIAFAVHAALGDVTEDIEYNRYEMRAHCDLIH